MTDWSEVCKLQANLPWQGRTVCGNVISLPSERIAELPDVANKQAAHAIFIATGLTYGICEIGVMQIRAQLGLIEPKATEGDADADTWPEEEDAEESEEEDAEESEEEDAEESEEYTEDSLSAMSKQDLYALATRLNVEGRSSMSKGELVEAILEADEE